MPLNFSSESHNEVKILGWEAKCYQNTAAILVLEAPYIIKHYDFVWFQMIIKKNHKPLTNVLLRPDGSDLDSRKHINSQLDHQIWGRIALK